jgi:type IV secretion system protein VirB3
VSGLQEDIFKGATRPPMLAGAPMLPVAVYFMATMLLFFWAGTVFGFGIAVFIPIAAAPGYAWMRVISRKDDQRLMQMFIKVRLTITNRNRRLWKARSYGPQAWRGAKTTLRRR